VSLDTFSNDGDVFNTPPTFIKTIQNEKHLRDLQSQYNGNPTGKPECPYRRGPWISTYRGLNAMMTSGHVDSYCTYYDRECTGTQLKAHHCRICARNAEVNGYCRLCNFCMNDDIFERKNQFVTFSTRISNLTRLIGYQAYVTALRTHREDLLTRFLVSLETKYRVHFFITPKTFSTMLVIFTDSSFNPETSWTPVWRKFIRDVVNPSILEKNTWTLPVS